MFLLVQETDCPVASNQGSISNPSVGTGLKNGRAGGGVFAARFPAVHCRGVERGSETRERIKKGSMDSRRPVIVPVAWA